MGRRVRYTERTVDSVAVMDRSWPIVVVVMAGFAHIVSAKAVKDCN